MQLKNKFTMIELLIVISIIFTVMAILIPAISKAREKTHVVLCVNNQRQLLLGGLSWSGSNDLYVLFSNWKSLEGKWDDAGWLYENSKRSGGWKAEDVKTSAIYPYLGENMSFYRCPSHLTNIGSGTRILSSYMMNGITNDYSKGNFFKIDDFDYNEVYMLESNPDGPSGMWNDGSNYPVEGGSTPYTQLSDRHFGVAQLGFFDGHTETVSDEDYADMLGFPGPLWCDPIHDYKHN